MIFNVGDRIKIDVIWQGMGEIVALRHAVGNHRTGALSYGADVLCGDGKMRFCFMHDLAQWNPERLAPLRGEE